MMPARGKYRPSPFGENRRSKGGLSRALSATFLAPEMHRMDANRNGMERSFSVLGSATSHRPERPTRTFT